MPGTSCPPHGISCNLVASTLSTSTTLVRGHMAEVQGTTQAEGLVTLKHHEQALAAIPSERCPRPTSCTLASLRRPERILCEFFGAIGVSFLYYRNSVRWPDHSDFETYGIHSDVTRKDATGVDKRN